MRKQMNIGTLVEENQIKAIIIKDKTGVDLMAVIKGCIKL
jgi:hypothetical protein